MEIISLEPLKPEWISKIELVTGQKVQVISREELLQQESTLRNAEVLICRDRDLLPDRLDVFENLKWVFIVSTGVDKVPFEYFYEKGIRVSNSPNISNDAMSDYVMGAALFFSCQFNQLIKCQAEKYWKPFAMTEPLNNKKMLIVGAGKIGQAIAHKAKAFGMSLYGICRTAKEIECFDVIKGMSALDDMCQEADFVVCTLPLTNETKYVFNEDIFNKMKHTAVFINIARGALVDTEALIKCLKRRSISGAVLDVFEKEPLAYESELWDLDNVFITPHSSGRVANYLERSMEIFEKNLTAYIKTGVPLEEIDLAKGY